LWGTVCWAQTPTSYVPDSTWTKIWSSDFTTGTWVKTPYNPSTGAGGHLTKGADSWPVDNNDTHGGEPQTYVDTNVTIGVAPDSSSGQHLVIQSRKADYSFVNPNNNLDTIRSHYTSGEIYVPTQLQYGYIEIKARMSNTLGGWQAFWFWNQTEMGYMGGLNGSLFKSATYHIATSLNTTPFLATLNSEITSGNLTAASFIDYNNGYVVSNNGKVRKTNNASGSATWRTALNNADSTSMAGISLNSVCFNNFNNGYIVGNGGKIFQTVDSSAHWTSATSGTTKKLNAVYFPLAQFGLEVPNKNTGYIVGDTGTFIKTTNGGTNWLAASISTTYNFKSIASSDIFGGTGSTISGNVFVVGGDASHGVLYTSTNFGGSWTTPTLPVTNQCLNSIYFTSGTNCCMVGNNGTIITGWDSSGVWIWKSRTSHTTNNLYSVSFDSPNNAHGCAVGANGTVLFTTDAGTTWNTITNHPDTNNVPSADLYFVVCNYDYDEMDRIELASGIYNSDVNSPYNQTYRNQNTLTSNYGNGFMEGPQNIIGGPIGGTYPVKDFTKWHLYGVEWTPSTITYYTDNQIQTILPNPGFQPSTGKGGMISQPTNMTLNTALAFFAKWDDNYTSPCNGSNVNWPGKGSCSSPLVTEIPGIYDYNYSTTTSPASKWNYSNYFDTTSSTGATSGGYSVFPYGSTFNTTSLNTSKTPFYIIDHVSYYKAKNDSCATDSSAYTKSDTITSTPASSNLKYLAAHPLVKKIIYIKTAAANDSIIMGHIPTNSPPVLRASKYIDIEGDFIVPLGADLNIIISTCY